MKYLLCLAPIALAACGQKELPVLILPPAELATCADEPTAPELPSKDGTGETQLLRDTITLDFILAFRSAWGDCKSKVDGLAAWRDSAGG